MLKDMSKKEKILLAPSIVGIAAAGYFGFKYLDNKKTTEFAMNTVKTLTDKVDTLNAAASEGLYEEALATTIRKLNRRQDQIKFVEEQLLLTPNAVDAIAKKKQLIIEITELSRRRDTFTKAQKLYEIKDI